METFRLERSDRRSVTFPLQLGQFPIKNRIKVWLGRNGSGETQVRLRLEQPRDFSVVLDVPTKVRADRGFRKALEEIRGPEALEVLAS